MDSDKYQPIKTAALVSAAIAATVLTIPPVRSEAFKNPVTALPDIRLPLAKSASGWNEVARIRLDNAEITAVAVDAHDRIYAGMKSSLSNKFFIAVFAADGKLLENIPATAEISSLAVAPDASIYLATGKQIVSIANVGGQRRARCWPPLGGKTILTALAADDKHVFAADAGLRQIYVYDRGGQLLHTVKGVNGFIVPSPYFDVVSDGDGGFWVADPGRHQLNNFTSDGRFIAQWTAEKGKGFLGCCNPAHFKLMSDGRFVTCEKGLVRIRIFGPDGKLLAEVCGPEAFRPGNSHGQNLAVDSQARIIVLDPAEKALRIFNRSNAP